MSAKSKGCAADSLGCLAGAGRISVIIPTIGRPDSLRRVLDSIAHQTLAVEEVIVADGSFTDHTALVTSDSRWIERGLLVKRIIVHPPNAVRQRVAAVAASSGEFLLLLDDDVVLERDCVEQMTALLSRDATVAAVVADFNNQQWPMPNRVWRWYMRCLLGMRRESWQGRVVGPLLRFGYNPTPHTPAPMEWLGAGNTLVRRAAYERAGGFSDFFLHRSTMNEDVDLGLKLSRVGRIVFCPSARMAHHHAPGGRVSVEVAAEDDLFNRFLVMRRTIGHALIRALGLVWLFFVVETASDLIGGLLRLDLKGFLGRFLGRVRALGRILRRLSGGQA